MELTWLADSCFRIRSRDAIILTDPAGAGAGTALQADIVTVSNEDSEAGLPAISGEPVIISGPGEYEVRDVLITGIRTYRDGAKGTERGKNTVFLLETESMTLCHLGDLGHTPSPDQVEALGKVDVLLVPVATLGGLSPAKAAEVVSLIGPKLVVPMTAGSAQEEQMTQFLKEMGAAEAQPQARFSVTLSALPSDMQVVLLERRR